jgi:hypothetical protein
MNDSICTRRFERDFIKEYEEAECECEGCEHEMYEAYNFQEMGFNVGFTWMDGHCFFMALDKKTDEWVAG